MRHVTVLYGDDLCEISDLIESGLGFASSLLIKGRGWQHERVVDDYVIFWLYFMFRHISFSCFLAENSDV